MIGAILGTAVRVAAIPFVAADAAADVLCGGDGSRRNREMTDSPLNGIVKLADSIADACEEIDR